MKHIGTFRINVNPKPEAIIVACGDCRFHNTFDEFRENVLQLPNGTFFPIRNAGGPTPLAHSDLMPSRCKGMLKQIMFLCANFPSIYRIILIGHLNCKYYLAAPEQCQGQGKELRDLPIAGGLVKRFLPTHKVEPYFFEPILDDDRVKVYAIDELKRHDSPIPANWTKAYQII